jgi:hypothetical protein
MNDRMKEALEGEAAMRLATPASRAEQGFA